MTSMFVYAVNALSPSTSFFSRKRTRRFASMAPRALSRWWSVSTRQQTRTIVRTPPRLLPLMTPKKTHRARCVKRKLTRGRMCRLEENPICRMIVPTILKKRNLPTRKSKVRKLSSSTHGVLSTYCCCVFAHFHKCVKYCSKNRVDDFFSNGFISAPS